MRQLSASKVDDNEGVSSVESRQSMSHEVRKGGFLRKRDREFLDRGPGHKEERWRDCGGRFPGPRRCVISEDSYRVWEMNKQMSPLQPLLDLSPALQHCRTYDSAQLSRRVEC